ncbi:hypothetical protein ACIP97_07585 [Peribacillus frigoritolerans]|uniref:hypothetical protein n=1 Tax=Peribacillus frigoritolerans TaxID=450367 RepID=UPI0038276BD7
MPSFGTEAPLGRPGQPADHAGAYVLLASVLYNRTVHSYQWRDHDVLITPKRPKSMMLFGRFLCEI